MANSSTDSITYWKNKVEEIEKELEEFRENSHLYEKELESSVEQAERSIKELKLRNNTLQLENDSLKEKFDELTRATEAQVTELEEETAQWHKREEEYVKYIRELEQKNDDLERSQRALYMSLGDFEAKLNTALERNVLLESELDDKEVLQTMVQRLKDEARDLKQEIQIREKGSNPDNDKVAHIVDSNKIGANDGGVQSPGLNNIPSVKSLNQTPNTNMSMTPPSRISAMHIIGDLLRKVGALESKLASCRGVSRESLSPGELREPFRGKRLNRGTSTPSIHNLVRS